MVGIYCIKNKIDNKVYVGQSSNIKKRWQTHLRELRCNKHHNIYLQRAYNKFGESAFVFELLEQCEKNRALLNDKETWWKYYFDNVCGTYNLGNTGNVRTTSEETTQKMIATLKRKHYQTWLGRHHTQEAKQKMSMASKQQWANKTKEEKEAIIERLAKANKGRVSWAKGTHLSLETRRKIGLKNKGKSISQRQKEIISLFNKGKVYSEETLNKMRETNKNKPCVQYDLQGNYIRQYKSIKEAYRQTKISYTTIAKVCKGNTKSKTAGGYIWKYANK